MSKDRTRPLQDRHAHLDRAIKAESLWEPRAYILERRFCPLEDIAGSLAQFREEAGANEAIILAFDDRVLFQSLSFIAHDNTPYGKRLVASLRKQQVRRLRPTDKNPLWRPVNNRSLHHVLTELADAALYEGAKTPAFLQLLLDAWGTNIPWQIVVPFSPHAERTVNAVILQRGGVLRRNHARVFFERTIERVNGTAHASVHRDRTVTRQVQAALQEIITAPGAPTLDSLLPPLVAMARRVTQSSGAAVFFHEAINPAPPERRERFGAGRLVCRSPDHHHSLRLRKLVLTAKDSSVVAWASFKLGLPRILPGSMHAPPEFRSTWLTDNGSPPLAEIAVPIPAGPGGGPFSQGVIVLCRTDETSVGPYGNYELALLRNVVLRIALVRAALMTAEAAALVAAGAQLFAVAEPVRWARTRARHTRRFSHPTSASLDAPLPIDIAAVMPAIRSVLDLGGRMTSAHSVTFRLLVLADDRRHGYAESVLRRVAAWPPERLGDTFRDLSLRDPSVNAWVALNGRPRHERDFAAPDAPLVDAERASPVQIEGRRTRSEYCAPVIVDDRLLGTINFESDVAHAFVLQTDVADACAAQIALAIASERRRYLREVLSIGSDVQAAAHELTNIADDLEAQLASRQSETVAAKPVELALQGIQQIISALAEPDKAPAPQGMTLDALVRRAARSADVLLRAEDVQSVGPWAPLVERRLYLAISEIFRNIGDHASADEEGLPRVYSQGQHLGGRGYVILEISHALRSLTELDPTSLYRIPIKTGRLHVGAFLAGAIIRSLGGDITARIIAAGDVSPARYLRTIIHIPEPPRRV